MTINNDENEILVIADEEVGERLDKILANRFKAIQSRTYFQMLIEENHVLVNGIPAKKRTKPILGDEISVNFVITPEIGLEPEAIPLDILYEDDALLIVNKAAGMVVHPATGNWTGTFVNALLHHCKELKAICGDAGNSVRPGIVHRLDKDTSGLMIAAKTTLSQQRLIEMFTQRRVHKEYLAICVGNPGTCEIRMPIGRHPIHRQRMAALPEGKEAITICKSLSCDGKLSLVNVVLATGRTHQIRVHMQYKGTPILGDSIYGNDQVNKKYNVFRQMLHAHLLRFAHPISGEIIEIRAPIPSDINHYQKLFVA